MNWLQIDKQIISMMRVISDKDKLYEDVKQVFKWNDSQVESAVGPLIKRWNWYDMHKEVPVKKKRTTKTTKKAPTKKVGATKTKAKKKS